VFQVQQYQSTEKVCAKCRCSKPINEFYEKERDARGNVLRRDGVCKDCRCQERTVRYNLRSRVRPSFPTIQKAEKPKKSRPKEIIERKKCETSNLVNEIDFSNLEASCGNELPLVERFDAVQRFNEFVALLREEYGKMVGGYVYIRKD
jgi:hypothetical protein